MVDYDVRLLEDLVMESEDEELEELLLFTYLDRDAELAEAAALRRRRQFSFESLPDVDFKKNFGSRRLTCLRSARRFRSLMRWRLLIALDGVGWKACAFFSGDLAIQVVCLT